MNFALPCSVVTFKPIKSPSKAITDQYLFSQCFCLKMSDSKEKYAKEFYAKDRKDHEQNLQKLCIKCLDRKGEIRLLDDALKKLVEKWLFPDYFLYEKYLPKGICGTCRKVLQSKGKHFGAKIQISLLLKY